MKSSLIIPLCFLSFIGCSGSSSPINGRVYAEEYIVDIDPIVLTSDNSVMNALQAWEDIAHVKFNINIKAKTCDDTCINEFTITSKPVNSLATIDPIQCGDGSCLAITYSNDTSSNVMIGDVVVEEQMGYPFQEIATHEIGHALGLIHTGTGTIMCISVGCQAPDITCEDLNQYNDLRGFPQIGCN